MALNKVGINQIGLAKKGTAPSTLTDKFLFGIKSEPVLKYSPLNLVKDDRDREWRNRIDFSISAKSLQPNLKQLKAIIDAYKAGDNGMDVELLSVPQTSGADGGCFQFFGNNCMGIVPTWKASKNERVLKLDMNVAPVYPDAQTILGASDSNTPLTWGITNYGVDGDKQRFPWLSFTDNNTIAPFNAHEIIDYDFELTGEGEDRDLDNRLLLDYIMFKLKFVFKAGTIGNLETMFAKSNSVAIDFTQKTGATTYEKFSLNQNVVTLNHDFESNATKRFVTLNFVGKVPLGNLTFDLTATGGGDAGSTGIGGTVSVAA